MATPNIPVVIFSDKFYLSIEYQRSAEIIKMHIAQRFENTWNLNSATSTGNLFLNLRDFPSFNIIFDKLYISFNIFLSHDNLFFLKYIINAYSNKHIFLGITGSLVLLKFENFFNILRVLCDNGKLCAVVKVGGRFQEFYYGVR